MAESV